QLFLIRGEAILLFPAEDGIRDRNVTGVQTCALPIFSFINQPSMKEQLAAALPRHMTAERMIRIATTEIRKVPALEDCDTMSFVRSEERRVGKECMTR